MLNLWHHVCSYDFTIWFNLKFLIEHLTNITLMTLKQLSDEDLNNLLHTFVLVFIERLCWEGFLLIYCLRRNVCVWRGAASVWVAAVVDCWVRQGKVLLHLFVILDTSWLRGGFKQNVKFGSLAKTRVRGWVRGWSKCLKFPPDMGH